MPPPFAPADKPGTPSGQSYFVSQFGSGRWVASCMLVRCFEPQVGNGQVFLYFLWTLGPNINFTNRLFLEVGFLLGGVCTFP